MGEGGADARYFMREMSVSEAEAYADGLSRRARQGWEQARLVASVVYGSLTGKTLDMELPWDAEGEATTDPPATAEELDALRARANAIAAAMNERQKES